MRREDENSPEGVVSWPLPFTKGSLFPSGCRPLPLPGVSRRLEESSAGRFGTRRELYDGNFVFPPGIGITLGSLSYL